MIQYHQKISNANRGMDFEKLITDTNNYYKSSNIALVYKKPTPIRVINFKDGYITKAVYDKKSTTDFSGIYKSKALDFEAKQIKGERFNFGNIKNHQLEHLIDAKKHGGISFLLLYFSDYDRCFFISSEQLIMLTCAKKSVHINELVNEVLVTDIVDYIKVVGEL